MIAVIVSAIMATIILRARNCFESEIPKNDYCDEIEINQRCVTFALYGCYGTHCHIV